MKQSTLLKLFISALVAAAIISALLYVVPLIDTVDEDGNRAASTVEIGASFLFVMVVEFLRAIFVISNTYIRRISKTWGVVMIFLTLLVTMGFGVATWFNHGREPWLEFFFWLSQIYNVLILASEWSVGTVVAGVAINWQELAQDFIDLFSLDYDYTRDGGGTKGLIDWRQMPELFQPLKDVIKTVHAEIKRLTENSEASNNAIIQAQNELKEKQDELEVCQKMSGLGRIAAGVWVPTGEENGGYAVFCGGPEAKGNCKPFRASRSRKAAICPNCGTRHDREEAQRAVQALLNPFIQGQ
jgi:hypothetical protein